MTPADERRVLPDAYLPDAVRQGSGLAGATETGDEVGSVLSIVRENLDLEEDYSDRLLIGVPAADIGAYPNAGNVQPLLGGLDATGIITPSLTFSERRFSSSW